MKPTKREGGVRLSELERMLARRDADKARFGMFLFMRELEKYYASDEGKQYAEFLWGKQRRYARRAKP